MNAVRDKVAEMGAYLLTFKGRTGKCARLAELADLLDNGGIGWRSGMPVHSTGPTDPTYALALESITRCGALAEERRAIEAELSRVGSDLARVSHGTLLDDYYLTAEDVSWQQVCDWYNEEHGTDYALRTIYRWRDAALEELAGL